MSDDCFQIDHQFSWEGSMVFYSKVDPSNMSGLLQCPHDYKGIFYSVEIGVEGNLSLVLMMGLLPLCG